jgi:hypothetical protein
MKIGGIIVVVGIFVAIGVAMYFYSEESFREVKVSSWGEPIMIGTVNFDIQYITNYDFLEKTKDRQEWEKKQVEQGIMEPTKEKPNGTFFQIQITAKNVGEEVVRMTGGEFHLYDIDDERWPASFVGYGEDELSVVELEQDKSVTVTTQFDIPYDEEMVYRVGIVPNRYGMDQTTEIAFICIKNCDMLLEN